MKTPSRTRCDTVSARRINAASPGSSSWFECGMLCNPAWRPANKLARGTRMSPQKDPKFGAKHFFPSAPPETSRIAAGCGRLDRCRGEPNARRCSGSAFGRPAGDQVQATTRGLSSTLCRGTLGSTLSVIARPSASAVAALKPSCSAARRGSPIETRTSPERAGR